MTFTVTVTVTVHGPRSTVYGLRSTVHTDREAMDGQCLATTMLTKLIARAAAEGRRAPFSHVARSGGRSVTLRDRVPCSVFRVPCSVFRDRDRDRRGARVLHFKLSKISSYREAD